MKKSVSDQPKIPTSEQTGTHGSFFHSIRMMKFTENRPGLSYPALKAFAMVIFAVMVITLAWWFGSFAARACLLTSGEQLKSSEPVKNREDETRLKALRKEIKDLEYRLARKIPSGPYMVINTHQNEFRLYRGKKLLREGKCSTGSYIRLEKDDNEKWIFKTPRGRFSIEGKITSPVWRKPDWAFVEEGLPVPPPTHYSRYEYGVLGDYALSLGQGYLIHGTLYKRYIGLPVTHGCIRLNDDDLDAVYRNMPVRSGVYIY